MSGAFRAPNSTPHAGVIAHSSFGQLKQPEPSMDSVHLYRYYIEQLALQNPALLLHSSPLIQQQPGHPPSYFNTNNLLQLTNSGFQPTATLLAANQKQMYV
jgi:hypothetical protein